MGRVLDVTRGSLYAWSVEEVDKPETCDCCGKALTTTAIFTDDGDVYCGEECMIQRCGPCDEESWDDAHMRSAYEYERGF